MRDLAVTAVRTAAVIDGGSGNTRERMNCRSREIRRAPILFLQEGRVVIAQAVIQSEPAGHLPGILGVNSELLFSGPGTGRAADAHRIDQAQQETRVTEAHVGAPHGRILERLAGGCGYESVTAVGPITSGVVILRAEFRAELIGMVALDPSKAGVESRTLRSGRLGRC